MDGETLTTRIWYAAIVLVIFSTGCGPEPASPASRVINPREITVMADLVIGDAIQIGDFLGAGGALRPAGRK